MANQTKILRKTLTAFLCLALTAAFLPAAALAKVPVEKIVPYEKSITLKTGDYYDLYDRVGALPYTGEIKFKYKSNASAIAKVSTKGMIKGIKPGKATVTVSSADGKAAKITVKVVKTNIPVSKINVISSALWIAKGQFVNFPLALQPYTAAAQGTTTSSNTRVAAITKEGYIKGINYGTATIKYTSASKKSASFTVTVTKDKLPTGVALKTDPQYTSEIKPYPILLNKGESCKVIHQVTPASAKIKTVVYYSDNTVVAKIDRQGVVKGVGEGKARIYAIGVGGWLGQYRDVYVGSVIPRSITLQSPTEKDVYLGALETITAEASVLPLNATNKTILWESSDPSIASVDADGNITMLADGSDPEQFAVITVRTAGNKELFASFLVHAK